MLIFINIIICYKFYLKKADDNLFIGKPANNVTLTEFSQADIFELKNSQILNQDIIIVTTKDDKVFDLNIHGRNLLYVRSMDKGNQFFSIQLRSDGIFKIQSNSTMNCLTFNPKASIIEHIECEDSNKEQNFLIQPVEEKKENELFIPVNRLRLEALKRAAFNCKEIKNELGAEAIAELGETDVETEARIRGHSLI
ncbi:hypothetical protein M153_16695000102 [Pseudoloma neurophilia]|uniref:Ricin B lectin domain-containing protein n=1 Tax=Pseudoloma neurophilia TaxID=146866 RepID=A0A0R0LZX5_9MICR|nr:hypothetical protein M153_16695000102 [Pseudoloma neurophilia]